MEQLSGPSLEPGVYDVRRGERVTQEELLDELAAAQYVILGETHDEPFHHRAQLYLLQRLARRAEGRGDTLALGMEMIQRPFQAALDRYASGTIDQATMLREVEWSERWGFSAELYAPLWQEASTRGIALVALNAPGEITRRVAEVGLQGLKPEERGQLAAEIDQSVEAHRAWFASIFASHGMAMEDPEALDRFYQAQLAWDETMAEQAVASRRELKASQLIVLAGSGHVMRRWGIPSRIARRDPEARVVTLIPIASPGSEQSFKAPTSVDAATLGRWREEQYADYVWLE